jgi:hypothetical protein
MVKMEGKREKRREEKRREKNGKRTQFASGKTVCLRQTHVSFTRREEGRERERERKEEKDYS